MGKNSNYTIRYETVVQLLVLAAVILTSFLAFNFKDYLELFNVSKTKGICISFWSSVKPWLSHSYVYLFINFIIFFIAASSSICSSTMRLETSSPADSFSDSSIPYHNLSPADSFSESSIPCHNLAAEYSLPDDHAMGLDPSSPADSFRDSSTPCHNLAAESLPHDHDHSKFHTLEDTCTDLHGDEVAPESVVDMRELRKSKTFSGGDLRTSGRRERYVRILSQEELDRRVEAFIYTFKKKKKESNEGLKLSSIHEPNLV